MLPYFAFQVRVPLAPSVRSIPRGSFHRFVKRSMWKSMFRPTITDPLASGQTTRVHIARIRSLVPALGVSEG